MNGTREAVLLFISAIAASFANAQTLTTLHIFAGWPTDGGEPEAGLVQGTDGYFYGTTRFDGLFTFGTVFRISSSGIYTNLYSFGSQSNDGSQPLAGVVQGSDGNFYGTTEYGGSGDGTIFRISPSGVETALYSFAGYPTDGANPQAGLVQGSDGNFYGTTSSGGSITGYGVNAYDYGTVFRISPSGIYTSLYSFAGYPTDGSQPLAGLVQGSDGNFYGTTSEGGTQHNYGTVFKISSAGTLTTLHSFSGGSDGAIPDANLVQGTDGNFYGTTWLSVFKITSAGTLTPLYDFTDGTNGGFPNALVLGNDGNFYGTCGGGGTYSNGTMFQITPAGTLTTLYNFTGGTDGGTPEYAGLVQGIDGCFYGTTYSGGATPGSGAGTVFKLCVPLSPPPNQISGFRLGGTNIIIAIPSVAGESYQLQFSTSMNPTNWVNLPGVSVTNSIGALLTLTNFGGAVGPQGFYRFAVTP